MGACHVCSVYARSSFQRCHPLENGGRCFHGTFSSMESCEFLLLECRSKLMPLQQCVICQVAGHGACLKCSDCPNEFHLSCAWHASCTFGFEITPVSDSSLSAILNIAEALYPQVKASRRDTVPVVTFKKETGVMSALVWCHAHDRAGRTVYGLGDVDPKTGLVRDTPEAGATYLLSIVDRFTDILLDLQASAERGNLRAAAKSSTLRRLDGSSP